MRFVMLRRQKVKDVAWKQLTLDSINRVGFEGTETNRHLQ